MRKYTLYYTKFALIDKTLTLGVRVTQYLVIAYMLSFKNISSHYDFKCGGSKVSSVDSEITKGMVKKNCYNNLNG